VEALYAKAIINDPQFSPHKLLLCSLLTYLLINDPLGFIGLRS